jgi:hypothetical protein
MKTYFSRIVANHWCAHNKSQEAAHKLAYEMERRILTADQVNVYKEEFKAKVDQINADHSRCKPLRFSIENSMLKKKIYFFGLMECFIWN